MRARGFTALALFALTVTSEAADPKPKPVDVKAFRDKLIVLQDDTGGTYIVLRGESKRVFYGVGAGTKARTAYEQVLVGGGSDDITGRWDISIWAPRIPGVSPGSVSRAADGTYFKYCGNDLTTPLTEVIGDKAKAILDKTTFMSSAMIRRPHLLARDDAGIYYYVDVIRKDYGGKGYRVFVGKKGAMKQKPLSDIATDTAGDVFATKTGDLRIVRDTTGSSPTVNWVKGAKRTTLSYLDVDANSPLIFKDLGVYGFTGTICENL